MKIILKKDENNYACGWEITAETEEEIGTVNTMRNLTFFGFEDTKIVYNGRSGGKEDYTDAGTLHWIQKKYKDVNKSKSII